MLSFNLEERTSGGKIRNLSGKEAGVAARAHFRLDELDVVDGPVDVLVPDFLYNISPSFFCGLFGESTKKLGVEKLLLHYRFVDTPDFLWTQIHHGVELCSTEYSD